MQRRPLTVALLALVAAFALAGNAHAAVGDLPRLTEGAPTGIDASWYDDHSVIGDNHLSWSPEGGSPVYTNTARQGSQKVRRVPTNTRAIVNRGGGTAKEVRELVDMIQTRVRELFGVEIHPEPNFIG